MHVTKNLMVVNRSWNRTADQFATVKLLVMCVLGTL